MHFLTARIAAFIVLGLAFAVRGRRIQGPALYLGRISYSLYPMHPIVMALVPQTGTPLMTFGLWLRVLLLVSSVTYCWIEQPGVALGQGHTA